MNPLVLVLLGAGVYWLWNNKASAYALQTIPNDLQYGSLIPGSLPVDVSPVDNSMINYYQDLQNYDDWCADGSCDPNAFTDFSSMNQNNITNAGYSDNQANINVNAFLTVLRTGESENTDNAYRRLFSLSGAKYWDGTFADHPAYLGWKGTPLTRQMCINAGFSSGVCYSNAAGAYQFISTTWKGLKDSLGLPDFSPAAQDTAAIELLRRLGALEYIKRGDPITAAMLATSQRGGWASMPGDSAGQGGLSQAQVQQIFANAGGVVQSNTIV